MRRIEYKDSSEAVVGDRVSMRLPSGGAVYDKFWNIVNRKPKYPSGATDKGWVKEIRHNHRGRVIVVDLVGSRWDYEFPEYDQHERKWLKVQRFIED